MVAGAELTGNIPSTTSGASCASSAMKWFRRPLPMLFWLLCAGFFGGAPCHRPGFGAGALGFKLLVGAVSYIVSRLSATIAGELA